MSDTCRMPIHECHILALKINEKVVRIWLLLPMGGAAEQRRGLRGCLFNTVVGQMPEHDQQILEYLRDYTHPFTAEISELDTFAAASFKISTYLYIL